MPDGHSKLSPSAAHRWLHCTASAGVEYELKDVESIYAKEGTEAHKICEKKLRFYFDGIANDGRCSAEMDAYTDEYLEYIKSIYNGIFLTSNDEIQIFIEQKLDLTEWIPRGFGTADCILASGEDLHVIDFKYGQGVKVESEENPQLKIYGLGALALLKDQDIKDIHLHIVQPRLENIVQADYTKEELLRWAQTELRPKAIEAFNGKGKFLAGSWCRFCRASDRCDHRNRQMKEEIETAKEGLKDLSYILDHANDWLNWIKEVQASSLARSIEGESIPGFKVVAGHGKRQITDPEAVCRLLEKKGYEPYKEKEMKPLTHLEKMLGKKTFNQLIGEYVEHVDGKPQLVKESDPRPAINSIESDFEVLKD